jgi:hypothetical protein
MKTNTLIKYRSRKFLNPSHGMAAIQVSAHYNEYAMGSDDSKLTREMDVTVAISDCGGTINLDFHAYNEKARAARIKKVNLIIDELIAVREVLEAGPVGQRKVEE